MNADLEAIKEAMDKATGDGRDHSEACTLADAYVAAHPEQFTDLAAMPLDKCVTAVDAFRAAGMDEAQWQVEAWLLHRFLPQNIGGTAQAAVRIPGATQ
jgi:hypothetical protein